MTASEKLKKASEHGFPYGWPGYVCYFVINDGVPERLHYRSDMRDALTRGATIYATWPGEYSTHLFVIDDPAALAKAIGHSLVGVR
ncbi:hypothetical protein I3U42_01200 [Mycobacteroides abscessus subsp. abscessus]|uniref:hypothetical protein n=1 Tax=Mycobacteroides abscessus TaxID=36809 RepID=UPI0019D2BE11|nr:hypothetical protein [Mycobacteroides abscessus]QSN26455.1 hypothetical protein I3U36_01200 [Mycobacteroides abscessus subsp. abscessus]QSN31712.1 hypothetical protein I3U42_01200 [Mycobacteroides abscessus subsp. abscessus]QST89424.1 hypothetical protein PROPHIGD43A-5_15 [Mycobacterium phage prophiGD43A-5]